MAISAQDFKLPRPNIAFMELRDPTGRVMQKGYPTREFYNYLYQLLIDAGVITTDVDNAIAIGKSLSLAQETQIQELQSTVRAQAQQMQTMAAFYEKRLRDLENMLPSIQTTDKRIKQLEDAVSLTFQ
jgi:hypothetical protein